MIKVTVQCDETTMSQIRRLVKACGSKMSRKGKTASFHSEGCEGLAIKTSTFGYISWTFSDSFIEAVTDLVVKYHDPVEKSLKALFAAADAFRCVLQPVIMDAEKIHKKFLTEKKK